MIGKLKFWRRRRSACSACGKLNSQDSNTVISNGEIFSNFSPSDCLTQYTTVKFLSLMCTYDFIFCSMWCRCGQDNHWSHQESGEPSGSVRRLRKRNYSCRSKPDTVSFTISMVTWKVSLVRSIMFVWLYSLSLKGV